VCGALGVARSNVHAMMVRGPCWRDGRQDRQPADDEALLIEIRELVAQLPSYGYRRACALVNRQRRHQGLPRVNPKQAYRVMADRRMLLPKAPKRAHSSRRHDGTVAVAQSDRRWCSDGCEIKCDSGATVTATFTKDCCDREIVAWRAWEGKGLPEESVREMLIEAVEKRFGSVEAVPAGHRLEFLSDNGGAYIAHDTRAIARSLGLTLINAPMQPAKQRHGRELRHHIPARLRVAHGYAQCEYRTCAATNCIRALQPGAPAFELEDDVATRIPRTAKPNPC
jgi:putative transposase